MKRTIHASAGMLALMTVLVFWCSTVVTELFMDHAAVVAVKRGIAFYGLGIMVLAMAVTGASGFKLGGGGGLLSRKQKRMRVIAANGVLIMIPCALFLYSRSSAGRFDSVFYSVQIIELAAGLLQLTLLGLNFRDGLRMAGHLRPARRKTGATR